MEVKFYETDSLYQMLLLILQKGRNQGLTFNLFFDNAEKAQEFSEFLWNKSGLAHGLLNEGYHKLQPILIATNQEASVEWNENFQKDVALSVETELIKNIDLIEFKKVCFINVQEIVKQKYKTYSPESWAFIEGVWKKN